MPRSKVLAEMVGVSLVSVLMIISVSFVASGGASAQSKLAATIEGTRILTTFPTKTTANTALTSPPQLLTGKVCSTAGATIQQTFYTQTGDLYDATYACTRCGGTGAITTRTYSWMPTRITTSLRANMCGASVEKTRSVQDITYFVSPLGRCSAQTKNTVQTFKREVSAVAVSCSASQTTLACTVLTDTTTTNWKNGKVWNSASSPQYGVPAGGQEDYVQTKTVKQTLLESRSCPAPYRKRGLDVCQVYATAADQAQFPIPFLCGKGSSVPIQARLTTFQVSPSFAFPVPRAFAQFATTLKLGITSEEVRRLQQFLNFQGFSLSVPPALGSVGNESTYFGIANQTALVKFQKAYGVAPANGALDANTIAKTNQVLTNQQAPVTPPADPPVLPEPPFTLTSTITGTCPAGKTLLTSTGQLANPQNVTVNVTITIGSEPNPAMHYSYNLDGVNIDGDYSGTGQVHDVVRASIEDNMNCVYTNDAQTYAPQLGVCAAGEVAVPSPALPWQSCTVPSESYYSPNSQEEADVFALAAAQAQCSGYSTNCYVIPLCTVIEPPSAGSLGQSFGFSVGSGATFYEARTVPFGNVCKSEERTCILTSPPYTIPTVAMTGSYVYNKCTVDPAPPPPPTPPTYTVPVSGSGSGSYGSGSGSGSSIPPSIPF